MVPPVVKALLAANIGVYLVSLLAGWEPARAFGLIPAELLPLRLYTLVTYMFLHGGFLHLLFNMFGLWMFGSALEFAWGSREFTRYYFICGIGGGIVQTLFSWGSGIPIIGASAAIYGILLAYGMLWPEQEVYLYGIFAVKMKYLVGFLVVVSLFMGFGSAGSPVAHFAHLGGMLFGFLYLKLDWRRGSVARKVRGAQARWQMEQNARRIHREEAEAATVDEILDKISRYGIESLSSREKQILREASQRR
jgi:membrane associated rhomboid family serine protease